MKRHHASHDPDYMPDPYIRILSLSTQPAELAAGVVKYTPTYAKYNGGRYIMEILGLSHNLVLHETSSARQFAWSFVGWDTGFVNNQVYSSGAFNGGHKDTHLIDSVMKTQDLHAVVNVGAGEAYAYATQPVGDFPTKETDMTDGAGHGYLFAADVLVWVAAGFSSVALIDYLSVLRVKWRPKWVSDQDFVSIRSSQKGNAFGPAFQ